MAGSNYDEMITRAVSQMAGADTSQRRPISSISSPLLAIYLGFLGFGCGVLLGLLSGIPTFYTGFLGVIAGVVLSYWIRVRSRRAADASLSELNAKAHDLEGQAARLEAEVARQSGAFDRWEKK